MYGFRSRRRPIHSRPGSPAPSHHRGSEWLESNQLLPGSRPGCLPMTYTPVNTPGYAPGLRAFQTRTSTRLVWCPFVVSRAGSAPAKPRVKTVAPSYQNTRRWRQTTSFAPPARGRSREPDSNRPSPTYKVGAIPRLLSRRSAPGVGFEPTMPFGARLTVARLAAHPSRNALEAVGGRLPVRAGALRGHFVRRHAALDFQRSSRLLSDLSSGGWSRTNVSTFRESHPCQLDDSGVRLR